MRTAPLTVRSLGLASLTWLLALYGCGSDNGNGSSKKGIGGATGTGGFGFGATGGIGVGGANGATCAASSDCASGEVCQTYAQVCVVPGKSCTTQTDCGIGTYCDTGSGSCLPAGVGNPCAADSNCVNGTCVSGTCQCVGITQEQELVGALDIYFIFDRTASMGTDCAYTPGTSPPVASKACYATYAVSDYLINVQPAVPTRFAFQFMSLASNDCDGTPYATPLVDLTPLPLTATDPIIQDISNETFAGGLGTHIEGAFNGLAQYTTAHQTPGHTIIGVLMTDGDPNGCNEDVQALSTILSNHFTQTGIKTFIIGMEGATDANLETYGVAGGADPHSDWCGSVAAPCHYWNVGNGAGDAIASALSAIIKQSAPLPCTYQVAGLTPPAGQTLDFTKVNVQLTDPQGSETIIGQVADQSTCPVAQPAWYYDNPVTPTTINLCPSACTLVTGAQLGSRVNVIVGCEDTVIIR